MPARRSISRARSAITGRFVRRSAARRNPSTTVLESRRSKPKKRG